jgi:hypothetical protein
MLQVEWDAGGSTDPDGHVVDYAWDFDADGYFEYDSGLTAKLPYYYYAPGDFSVIVQVTDDDGAMSFASAGVSVSEAQKWHITEVADAARGRWDLGVAESADRPAVAYYEPYEPGFVPRLLFRRADDSVGTTWGAPSEIPEAAPTALGLRLAVLGGKPTILEWFGTSHVATIVQATDESGTAWGAPRGMPFTADAADLAIVQGNPAIVYAVSGTTNRMYSRAVDETGAAWAPSNSVGSYLGLDPMFLGEVGTAPAVVGRLASALVFIGANDLDGVGWRPAKIVDYAGDTGLSPVLRVLDGKPCIAYGNFTLRALMFVRAADSNGDRWAQPVTVDVGTGNDSCLVEHDGRPGVFYHGLASLDLRYIYANDESGLRWGKPVTIESARQVAGTPFSRAGLVISSCPVICYLADYPTEDNLKVKCAAYY